MIVHTGYGDGTKPCPFQIEDASTEYRKRSFGGVVGYDILVKKSKENENDMKSILTAKLIFDANRYTRFTAILKPILCIIIIFISAPPLLTIPPTW